MEFFNNILMAIWFFLPVGIANSIPVVAMHIPILKDLSYPIDFYKSINGVRIFGDHKTFRGLITGMIFALIVVLIQAQAYNNLEFFKSISWVNYSEINLIGFGLMAGAGALLGDAFKSFFKRRMNLKPGATWFPFDQIDYIIGGICFTIPFVVLDLWQYALISVIYFILHPVTTFIGWVLKMKESPI